MRRFFSAVLFLLFFSFSAFAATSATDVPLGQSAGTADDLFETQRGYFHPALSLSEVYTDNLFNTKNNTETEYITTITPAFWLSFPGQLQPAEPVVTDTTAAGGQLLANFGKRDDRPFQAFLSYEAGIKRHKNFSSEDITTHKLHGLVRGTLTSGLSLDVNNIYIKSHDAYATYNTSSQNKYTTNLIALKSSIPVGERFKIRFDYSNFLVDYDDLADRDRSDNTVSGYLFYALSQKTKLFGQLDYVDVSYDTNTSNDNTQQRYFLGVDYAISGKVQTLAKVGYNTKDRNGTLSTLEEFVYELQADYQFTPKNNLVVQFWRKVKETDTPGTNGIIGSSLSATFSQQIGQRIVSSAQVGWLNDEYSGSSRDDDYLTLSLALSYSMQKWFEISGGYNYVQRDSSDNSLDYDSNGLFLNLTGRL